MQPEIRKHPFDIRRAASDIRRFTAGRTLDAYLQDQLFRYEIERLFEIVGEAMTRLAKADAQTAESISE